MWWVGYDKVWLVPILELVVNVENIFTFGLSLSLSLSLSRDRKNLSLIYLPDYFLHDDDDGRPVGVPF